ncbi:MAG TPA: DUF998 domain-containing protein [Acidimicrobiales bacterium]|jgi:hypothetical membrane protein|nr:DUF998 domain-containing protein [Acidimicrobiales bacterium]
MAHTTVADEHRPRRWLAAAGVLGPATFVADWAVLGATSRGYSPVEDAISRLAATGASTRGAMTAGFVAYGAGLVLYAIPVRAAVAGRAWMWVAATGVATFGVAAFPLGTQVSGNVHAVFATVGYATLAAVPLTAAPVLARAGRRGWARVSVAAGALCAGALLASIVGPTSVHGLLQRLGLTVGDAWLVVSAGWLLTRAGSPRHGGAEVGSALRA